MLEAVLVHVLGDDGLAVGLRHQGHVLRLKVGREPGERPRRHVGRQDLRSLAPPYAKPPLAHLDARARLLELEQDDVEVLGPAAFEAELTARGHRGDRVRAGLEVVRHHCVVGAAELRHAVNHEPLRPDALDAGAHLSEQPAEVLHVRLAGRVEDLGPAFGAHGRQQDVLGAGDRGQVEDDAGAAQAIGMRDQLGGRLSDRRAHLAEPAEVLLDAAGADVVAARPRQSRAAEASEQRPQKQDGRAHPLAQVVRHARCGRAAGVDGDRALAVAFRADALEDLRHHVCVGDARHVLQVYGFLGQKSSRHLGQGRVLGTADA